MALSASEIARYHIDGYLVPDFRLSPQWLGRMQAAYDALCQKHPHTNRDFIPSPHIPNYVPGVVDYKEWLAFARISAITEMTAQLIGPDFAMWGSAVFGKPAYEGKATPMHQDGEYWPIKPLASITVWIALDAATPENGCLRVVPGSHKARAIHSHRRDDREDWTLNQVLDVPSLELNPPVDVVLEAGQISFHDVYMVHGSNANQSPKARRGLTYRYMPTTSFFDHDLAGEMTHSMGTTDMSQRPLVAIGGVDRCARNDYSRGHHVYPAPVNP